MDVRSLVVTWPENAPRGEVTRFVEEHGVSRAWFYDVRGRARSEGAVAAMQPRPRSPGKRHPQAIPAEVEELAVQIRKELANDGWDHGPLSVRYRLQELGVAAPAASTLARVFTRHGMVVPQPQKRPRSSYKRFQFARVHECWQLDATEWMLADGSVCVIFQLLDDHSRYLIASRVAPGERSADAVAVVRAGIERFQVPCLLLSDNGTAVNRDRLGRQTQLVALLTSLGCRPITGRPVHPQTQGKDERVHQTLQRWLRARPAAATRADLQRLVDEFDEHYNHHRPHQSLNMQTPAYCLTHDPLAIAPEPPDPEIPARPVRAETRRVARNGKISVKDIAIQLGSEHAGTRVTVITSNSSLNIFGADGLHIRSLVLIPGKTYYSNGRPRGRRRPPPKCPD
jgi:transposase InsO family protein